MKSAGKARSNGLYRHIRTSKEIIRNLLNDSSKNKAVRIYCRISYLTFGIKFFSYTLITHSDNCRNIRYSHFFNSDIFFFILLYKCHILLSQLSATCKNHDSACNVNRLFYKFFSKYCIMLFYFPFNSKIIRIFRFCFTKICIIQWKI